MRRRRCFTGWFGATAAGLLASGAMLGCGDDADTPKTFAGTGGALGTGGAGTGGPLPTGGAATGGLSATGGLGTGGGLPTGGVATGGALGTGGLGTGGGLATGGALGTGGLGTGGVVPTGGIGTGGVLPTGGVATGGDATGGDATGGDATGGDATGGVPTGGAETGGTETGGTGGTGGLTLLGPVDRGGGLYAFEMDGTYFAVSTAGGKVVAFGPSSTVNLLTTSSMSALNFGSTLWTSPQSVWNWPPPVAIDSGAYTASVVGNVLTLTSNNTATIGGASIRMVKAFEPDLTDGSILVTYTVQNTAGVALSLAPWEVTRFYAGGLTVYPKGSVYTASPATTLTYSDLANHIWYDQTLQAGTKLFGDSGDGWIAHVDRRADTASDDYLVVMQWLDVPQGSQAPGEGEVEIYNGSTYIEMEVQGPYVNVPVGGSTTFSERWTVTPLGFLNPAAGDARVTDAIAAVLQ